ncbi:ABC transporter ATP-binding protein [Clostridia bacterium]|nr:ABC transporter ATP-binding protein [Clostridia bacterium]
MNLSINAVNKSYGKNHALVDFNASLTAGIYALMGPNGSGKSTLMNIITDNLKSDSGAITYDGEDTLKMGVRFREKLGFMPQYPGMYPNFSVERFMWYMAALKGISKSDAKTQIAEILTAVELDDCAKKKIGSLSGGMKQRLALAQAVLGNPEVLILDEPTAGLDPKQRIAIRNYISRISFNKIVIIATHVVSDVEFIAKEIIILKKGEITDHEPSNELTKKIAEKVWSVTVSEEQVIAMQSKYRVINIAKTDAGVSLRVLSETCPEEDNVTAVTPSLEDYYLWVFGDEAVAELSKSD